MATKAIKKATPKKKSTEKKIDIDFDFHFQNNNKLLRQIILKLNKTTTASLDAETP